MATSKAKVALEWKVKGLDPEDVEIMENLKERFPGVTRKALILRGLRCLSELLEDEDLRLRRKLPEILEILEASEHRDEALLKRLSQLLVMNGGAYSAYTLLRDGEKS